MGRRGNWGGGRVAAEGLRLDSCIPYSSSHFPSLSSLCINRQFVGIRRFRLHFAFSLHSSSRRVVGVMRVSLGAFGSAFLPLHCRSQVGVQPGRARCSTDSRPGRAVLRSPCDTLSTPIPFVTIDISGFGSQGLSPSQPETQTNPKPKTLIPTPTSHSPVSSPSDL